MVNLKLNAAELKVRPAIDDHEGAGSVLEDEKRLANQTLNAAEL